MTDPGRCGSCKHWGASERGDTGSCYTITNRTHVSGTEPLESAKAWLDSFDEDASLTTLPAFGCVLWEAR